MFKKSRPSSPPDLFASHTQHLSGKRLKKLEDQNAWQNSFYREITSKINEDHFSPLYHEGFGRANAPVRILIGMIILKEGNNWTDEQLFESCDYNLLVQRALGLTNFSDEAPSPATYYNFKLALLNYEKDTGINLLDKSFQSITKDQIIRYNVSGQMTRMDSKLLQSNIAKTTRLQMALGVVIKFYKSLSPEDKTLLNHKQSNFLTAILKKSPEQYTYQLNKTTAAEQLEKIGQLVFQLYTLYSSLYKDSSKDNRSEAYEILSRLWQEHFELVKSEDNNSDIPKPKDMKDQGGTPLQSAHDPQATYRNKQGSKKQIITGYVSNITETCSIKKEGEQQVPLQLITDVQTAPATKSDVKFFKSSLERTREVLNDKIEIVLTDGGYNSDANEKISNRENESFDFLVTAIQGLECAYDFEPAENGTYKVIDRRNGIEQIAKLTKAGKYRIDEHHAKYKYRYIEEKTIVNYFRKKEMEKYPDWVYGLRANTEATIHQVFCKLNGAKTKYRGLFQHQTYVLARAFWVNFKRINKQLIDFIEKTLQNHLSVFTATIKAQAMILFFQIFKIKFDKILF